MSIFSKIGKAVGGVFKTIAGIPSSQQVQVKFVPAPIPAPTPASAPTPMAPPATPLAGLMDNPVMVFGGVAVLVLIVLLVARR